MHALDRPGTLLPAYALVDRIGLVSSKEVVEAANGTVRRIAEQCFGWNMTLDEMREFIRATDAHPRLAFGQASRHERHALRQRV